MHQNGVLAYLHGDHLFSTSLTTNSGGTLTGDAGYTAYGRYRRGSEVVTENRFTSQKLDATGLYYFNARYYDPQLGTFISPDTLVSDPTNLFSYNRYMYTLGNPLRYNDPSGHASNPPCCVTGPSLVPQILQLMADVATVVLEPAGEAVQVVADHPMFGRHLANFKRCTAI